MYCKQKSSKRIATENSLTFWKRKEGKRERERGRERKLEVSEILVRQKKEHERQKLGVHIIDFLFLKFYKLHLTLKQKLGH